MSEDVFVHPQGLCESDEVGPGTRIWAFAHVMNGAVVGENCNICGGVFIESGARVGNNVTIKNSVLLWDKVTIEDDVFLGPNVVFTNDLDPRAAFKKSPEEFLPTLVRAGASIGANATIVCGIELGEFSFVGAGSVVTKNVPAYALFVGNPAKYAGWMCQCGARLPQSLECTKCGRKYEQLTGSNGLKPN